MLARRIAALGAGAAALALIAGPAFAGAPYTVAFNGDISGADHTVTFANGGGINLAVNGKNLSCSASSLVATVHTGTFNNPADIADIDPASFTGCTFGPPPSTTTVTATTPWHFIATGGNTTGTSDAITGTLTGVAAHITINGPFGACKFVVSGSVSGVLLEDNSLGGQALIATSSSLTVSSVDGALTCLSLVSNGNAATLTASYDITGTPIQVS
jgi:hypothetical protein